MGERLLCKQEVAGSSPAGSISPLRDGSKPAPPSTGRRPATSTAGEHLREELLEDRASGKAHAVGVAHRGVVGQALGEPVAEKAPDRDVALGHPQGLAHRGKALDRCDQEELDEHDGIDRGTALVAVEGAAEARTASHSTSCSICR